MNYPPGIRPVSKWKKWLKWEYWPVWLANIPLAAFWLWFAIRTRRLFFFTAVNPTIETGGFFGESKMGILRQIPQEYLPTTLFFAYPTPVGEALHQMQEAGLHFPVILKPDVGERGLLVERIDTQEAFIQHYTSHPVDWLLQDYVSYSQEGSILYYRMPGSDSITITSFCIKEFLQVTGDGISTVDQLMQKSLRASLQLPRFRELYPELLAQVLPLGKDHILEPIGNHSRGTTFLSGNHWIDKTLEKTFAQIAGKMQEIHYGRFDLRFRNLESLKKGQHFRILEFNGIAAEPAHIYDPSIPVLKKYGELFRHWQFIFKIYREQYRIGLRPESWRGMLRHYQKYRSYLHRIRQNG